MKIKKFVSVMLVAVMITILFPQTMNVFAHEYSDDRVNYLVVAKNESSYNVISQEYKTELCEDKTVSDDSMVLSLTESEAESIEEYAGTKYIEEDILFNESNQDISTEDLLSDFLGIDTEEAEEVYPNNILMVNGDDVNIDSEENIVVGILDSGIANHDDLNVTKRVCLIPDMYVDNNLFSYDLSGHGTGVAGVIGAKNNDKGIIGIYENVELYSIQVLTPTGQAPLSRIVAGIDWAIENGVDVLNMSFGTNTNSQILYDAIVRANNSGMVLVAAAGNTESATQYPAKYSEVISVGSVDGSGNISDFSAKDSFVDIYAPGESVQTTTIVSGYTAQNGTSLAAPHVTAAAALIKAKNRQRTTADIKNLILATANKSVEENEKGILDIENMLANADDFDYTDNQMIYQNAEPFDEYNEENIVVGSWAASAHQQLTQQVYNENVEEWNQSTEIDFVPDIAYFQLMIQTSRKADELYGMNVDTAIESVDGNTDQTIYTVDEERMYNFYPLHAYGYEEINANIRDRYTDLSENAKDYNSNYVADLKYLYRLARCYVIYEQEEGESVSDAILREIAEVDAKSPNANKTQLNAIARSWSSLYTAPIYGKNEDDDIIVQGTKSVRGIIYEDMLEGVSVDNSTLSYAFKILGLALHLAGDSYAHRVQIPTWSTVDVFPAIIDDEDFPIAHDFSFVHNEELYSSTKMYLLLRYRDKNLNVCKCYDCFRGAVSNGQVEFRDIISFHDDDAEYYEADKTNFYGERYSIATKHATERLISLFLQGDDFSITVFDPQNSNYNLKLNNLKEYIECSGVNWYAVVQRYPDLATRIQALSTSDEI